MGVRQVKRAAFLAAVAIAAAVWASALMSPGADARAAQIDRGGGYVGAAACASCHKGLVDSHRAGGMSRALEPVSECLLLIANPRLTAKLGPFTYEIVREGSRSIYKVSDGARTIAVQIAYAFGQGKAGQTYVLEYGGAFYESRVSYYTDIRGLDLTLGHTKTAPSLEAALGRRMYADETRDCFSCHTTGAVEGRELRLARLEPGVSCEACHGPGAAHVAAMKAGDLETMRISTPKGLGADELSQDFCGKCHRSAETVVSMPLAKTVDNVRFQPYRIFGSRCYSDDTRIGCTACHDPHAKLELDVAFYDAKCLACHQQQGAKPVAKGPAKATEPPCPVGTANCASCHMPKVEVPGAHMKFTDHRIRVVKPGEKFPL